MLPPLIAICSVVTEARRVAPMVIHKTFFLLTSTLIEIKKIGRSFDVTESAKIMHKTTGMSVDKRMFIIVKTSRAYHIEGLWSFYKDSVSQRKYAHQCRQYPRIPS